ncbi:MAG TPA: FixH family protein [Stenomitos sp.]
MTAPVEPSSPDPRRGWGTLLLLILLVAGVVASRYWIGAQRSVSGTGAAWHMTVAEPSGTVIHQPTRFEATVLGADGRPVEGLQVDFDLTMPDMEMPLNRFAAPAVPGQPGHYRGEGTFTMKGRWQIEAIARQGDRVATARRLVQVR